MKENLTVAKKEVYSSEEWETTLGNEKGVTISKDSPLAKALLNNFEAQKQLVKVIDMLKEQISQKLVSELKEKMIKLEKSWGKDKCGACGHKIYSNHNLTCDCLCKVYREVLDDLLITIINNTPSL